MPDRRRGAQLSQNEFTMSRPTERAAVLCLVVTATSIALNPTQHPSLPPQVRKSGAHYAANLSSSLDKPQDAWRSADGFPRLRDKPPDKDLLIAGPSDPQLLSLALPFQAA